MIFDWDDVVAFSGGVQDWEFIYFLYVPPTVSGKTVAGQPRIVYFGEVEQSIPSVFVSNNGLRITFHDGTQLTYHDGSNVEFHLSANPEIRDVMGDVPRIVFFGEADL